MVPAQAVRVPQGQPQAGSGAHAGFPGETAGY